MKNQFCIPKEKLLGMWIEQQKSRTDEFTKEFIGTFSLQEMVSQMEKEEGEFWDHFKTNTNKFSNKTANVEIFMSCELADFYFSNSAPVNVCFEMRSNFVQQSVNTIDELARYIENDTHVDCSMQSGDLKLDFQIKRYPEQYKEFNSQAVMEFLQKVFSGYGDMKNTILAILLQPNSEKHTELFFEEIYNQLVQIKDKVKFSEIIFLFNLNNKNVVFVRVYPDFSYSHKPIEWRSEKMKEKVID